VDIIMLTVYMDPHKIFQSLYAGACGYLLKSTPFPQILESIRDVRAGGSPMSPQIARKVIEHFQPEKPQARNTPFTPKELEVIVGLVEGLSYKMIGDRMGVSLETVRSHIKSIYRKMHVHGKAEVISKSLKGEI
jgi:DNA-binding NarL/FixJ family response regulator